MFSHAEYVTSPAHMEEDIVVIVHSARKRGTAGYAVCYLRFSQ